MEASVPASTIAFISRPVMRPEIHWGFVSWTWPLHCSPCSTALRERQGFCSLFCSKLRWGHMHTPVLKRLCFCSFSLSFFLTFKKNWLSAKIYYKNISVKRFMKSRAIVFQRGWICICTIQHITHWTHLQSRCFRVYTDFWPGAALC